MSEIRHPERERPDASNRPHSTRGDEKEQRTAEILKKIRGLEIKTRALVETAFAGDYHSVFKGRGMNFEEVREYQPGDEIRAIDWNVTARLGSPFVKKFTEERELTVMLIVDGECVQVISAALHNQNANWLQRLPVSSPSVRFVTTTKSASFSSAIAWNFSSHRRKGALIPCESSAKSSSLIRSGAGPTQPPPLIT